MHSNHQVLSVVYTCLLNSCVFICLISQLIVGCWPMRTLTTGLMAYTKARSQYVVTQATYRAQCCVISQAVCRKYTFVVVVVVVGIIDCMPRMSMSLHIATLNSCTLFSIESCFSAKKVSHRKHTSCCIFFCRSSFKALESYLVMFVDPPLIQTNNVETIMEQWY